IPAPLPLACASQRLCPHSPLWLPRQPAARHFPAALPSTTRSPSAIAHRTRSLPCPGSESTSALSQMWRPHGGHRETYGCPDPTPFSALYRRSRRMKPISQNRKPRSVFRLDPPSCALPPKKVLVPDPESVTTAIIFYFNHRLPAILLFTPPAHRFIAYLYATHRRYTKPISTAPDRTAGRLPSGRCIKSDRRRF